MATGGNTGTELDAAFDILQSDLGEEWKQLALELGLKYNIVDQELMISHDFLWRKRTMLEKWRQQEGKQATVQELLLALKKIKRQDLVDRLRAMYPDLQDPQLNTDVTEKCQVVETVTPPLSDISTGFSSSPPKQYSTEERVLKSSPRSKQSVIENTPSVPSTATSSSHSSESSEGKENKRVKKKTGKKTRKATKGKQSQQSDRHSSDPKFVLNAVSSMQLARETLRKCYYLVVESSAREEILDTILQIDDSSLDLCKEFIIKQCKGFDTGKTWKSSICVQMFPKTAESISELNRYQESGKLAADLQTEFENIGLKCPLEVKILTMEQLEEEVAEIVEEAMDMFVLSVTQETDEDSEECTQTQETDEESSQTYEELRDTWRDALLKITAWTGDEDKVKTLLQAGVQVNTENSEGETPLWDAVKGGHANIVTLLLQAGANPDMVDANGSTPLLHATSLGYLEVCRTLVCGGADVNMADTKLTQTPLRIAIEKSDWLMLTTLIRPAKHSCANVNKPLGTFGGSPLSLSVKKLTDFEKGIDTESSMVECRREWYEEWCDHVRIFKILVRAGAKIDSADRLGQTLLQSACKEGCAMTAKLLLDNGADRDKQDDKGRTPIWVAAWQGHAEIVSALIQEGADLNKADTEKKTPLWIAARKGHAKVVKTLIEAGADISLRDNTGMTPLRAATKSRQMNRHAVVSMLVKAARRKPCVERVRKTSSREKSPGYHTTEDFEYG